MMLVFWGGWDLTNAGTAIHAASTSNARLSAPQKEIGEWVNKVLRTATQSMPLLLITLDDCPGKIGPRLDT